jgi:hypothetical protein
MRYLKDVGLAAALLGVLLFAPGNAKAAQVTVGVGIGPVGVAVGAEPVCAYGYYPFAPYACAPVGYWGPNYFVGGIFVGAGPWFRGWGHPYGSYVRPGYAYRPGWGYRTGYGYRPGYPYHGGYAYHGAPAHGFVGGGSHGVGGYHANVSGGHHGGGSFHGAGRR